MRRSIEQLLQRRAAGSDEAVAETFATFAQRAPVGRNGRPEDVAAAIVALLANGFITGAVLPCDGGLRLT